MYNGIDQSYTCWTRYGEKRNETADYEMHDRVRNTAPTKGESLHYSYIVHFFNICSSM